MPVRTRPVDLPGVVGIATASGSFMGVLVFLALPGTGVTPITGAVTDRRFRPRARAAVGRKEQRRFLLPSMQLSVGAVSQSVEVDTGAEKLSCD